MSDPFLERQARARRRVPLTLLVGLAVTAALVLTGVWALSADTVVAATHHHHHHHRHRHHHKAAASALVEQFRVLRRAARSDDSAVGEMPRDLGMQRLDLADARRLADGFWLVPSGDQACLVEWQGSGGGVTCADAQHAANGDLFVYDLQPPTDATGHITSLRIWGLLPDGAHDVSVTESNGATVPIRVSRDNFYTVDAPGIPRELRFTDSHGERHTATLVVDDPDDDL